MCSNHAVNDYTFLTIADVISAFLSTAYLPL